MKGKILITDSLFIFKEHEEQLRNAGYEIERLDKPEATEEELIEAVRGKIGYILGGIEKLTNKIVDAGTDLKAIVFTGIGYKNFIPNWEYVTGKGIAIANTPDGPTHAVAEWSVTTTLSMNRSIFDLGRMGAKKFLTTAGIEGQQVGIIGLGRIGTEITKILKPFKPSGISYYSKHRHENLETELGVVYSELELLLKNSDIIFLTVSEDAGDNFMAEKEITLIKDDALLVSLGRKGIVNTTALLAELKTGRIRAVFDEAPENSEFKELPLGIWCCSNASSAFNTKAGLKLTSDMATQSMLNLLETGQDTNRV